MNNLIRGRILAAGAIVLLSAAACSSSAVPEAPPDIIGTVTEVDRDFPPRWFLLEENPEDSSGSAKAHVRLAYNTRVLRVVSGRVESADPLAVIRGESARVWFKRPVAESYPVQATADVVLIDTVR